MKLRQLLNTLDTDTPFVIEYNGEHQYFPDIESYYYDSMLGAIENNDVSIIWYSATLYGAIVVEVEDNA